MFPGIHRSRTQRWLAGAVAAPALLLGAQPPARAQEDVHGRYQVGQRVKAEFPEYSGRFRDGTVINVNGAGSKLTCCRYRVRFDDEEPLWREEGRLVSERSIRLPGPAGEAVRPANAPAAGAAANPVPMPVPPPAGAVLQPAPPAAAPVAQAAGPAQERATPDAAHHGCAFNKDYRKATAGAPASADLFKGVIFEAESALNRRFRDFGLSFLEFRMAAPFENRVHPGVNVRRDVDAAPPGATIHPIKARLVTCQKDASITIRRVWDIGYTCFKDRHGDWACPNNAPTMVESTTLDNR